MASFLPVEPNRSLAPFIDACLGYSGDTSAAPTVASAVAAVTYVPTAEIASLTMSSL